MAAIDKGADFVIGSRYVKGGSIPKEWGFMRRLNSLGGNIVGRYIAGLYKIRDCTAGLGPSKHLCLEKWPLMISASKVMPSKSRCCMQLCR